MKLVNLTPHPINIITDNLNFTIPPDGRVARCVEQLVERLEIDNDGVKIPVLRKVLGKVENLPEPQTGILYIVSLPVAQAVNRKDLLTIGEPVRNEKGQITGCRSLAFIS